MNKFQNLVATVKERKVAIIQGSAVILGVSAGLVVGLSLLDRATTLELETDADTDTDAIDVSDSSTDAPETTD